MTKAFDPTEPLHPSRALTPMAIRVNEQRVARGFWPKFRKVATKVPFAADALSVYYAARDPLTPIASKGMMLAALAYFIMPIDAIPDIIPGLGFTDDAAVFAALIALLGRTLKPHHKEAAQALLERFGKD
jgi:uncharacterized membrane protein YkvA (DUF1232 family)